MQIIAAEETIEPLARVLVNRTLYGASHPITRRTFDQAWERLRAHLADNPELKITLAEGRLLLQGHEIERPRATTRLLAERLQKHSVNGIIFTRACRAEGIDTLCELLDLPPREDPDVPSDMLAERLAKSGVQGIAIEKAVFKRVSDMQEEPGKAPASSRETPTSESELIDFFSRFRSEPTSEEPENVASPPKYPSPVPPVPSTSSPEGKKPTATVKEMGDFLDGKESRPAENALKNAGGGREKDISAMITLFIATMMMKRREYDLDPQSFADSLLGSLKSTYSAIQENATQGGRQAPEAIRKINSGLVEWMKSPEAGVLPDGTAERASEIADAVATQAEISAAYNAFVSSQKKFRQAEAQWQSVNTRYGNEKILAAGLSPASAGGAHEPVTGRGGDQAVPAVPPPAPTLPETRPPEDLALQAMLSALRFSADEEGSSVNYPLEIEKLREQIDQLIDSTTRKIEALLEKKEKLKQADNATVSASPKELLEKLSEAVQELLQPLSVVSCSLDILNGPRYEKMNEANRRNTIELALENSRRIETLIEKLGAVSGLPDDLYPHPEII